MLTLQLFKRLTKCAAALLRYVSNWVCCVLLGVFVICYAQPAYG